MVLLGDCDLARPLRKTIAPILAAGIRVRWIPGNHDVDDVLMHDGLWVDHAAGNLHATWAQLGGLLMAGLGGVFKSRVWYPRHDQAEPARTTRRKFLREFPRQERWRGGLPLQWRDTIFPEDAVALAGLRVDVLASHEAPSTHRHGFVGLAAIAAACGAKLIVHGHHHESYEAALPDGTRVGGLAKAEVYRVAAGDVR